MASPNALEAVLRSDPSACNLLLSLFSTAAFSPRFASLLSPLPHPARYHNAAQNEPYIALLRADLLSLPRLPTALSALPLHLRLLLSGILLLPDGTPCLRSCASPPSAPAFSAELSRSPRRRVQRFEIPRAATASARAARAPPPLARAFHGSPPERWYSIVRNGLSVRGALETQNGRLYGEAVYLAREFALAAAFAPHESAGKAGALQAMSVVGEFQVEEGAVRARHVPDGYVVVPDASAVQLIALVVLVESRGGEHVGSVLKGALGWVKGVGVLHLAMVYVVVLVIISNWKW